MSDFAYSRITLTIVFFTIFYLLFKAFHLELLIDEEHGFTVIYILVTFCSSLSFLLLRLFDSWQNGKGVSIYATANIMLKKSMDLSRERTLLEAFDFYFFYMIIYSLLYAASIQINGWEQGLLVGFLIEIILSAVLPFLILSKKKLLGNFTYIAMVILSVLSALFLGLGGPVFTVFMVPAAFLIPTAFLATRKSKA